MTREQRLVFGEVADAYDRARPGYPESLVDEVVRYAGLAVGDPALEVGCGTGKATRPFAARGLRVVALEPDDDMAALARANCRDLDVGVRTVGFEDSELPPHAFRLVYAAQAWHWVRRDERLSRAHDVLGAGGTIALFWNRPDWPDTPLRHAIDEVYARLAPDLGARTPGRSPQDAGRRECTDELAASPLFGGVTFTEHPWSTSYDAAAYVELLSTQSDHRMLAESRRVELLDAVAAAIDAGGGAFRVDYVADLYTARREG